MRLSPLIQRSSNVGTALLIVMWVMSAAATESPQTSAVQHQPPIRDVPANKTTDAVEVTAQREALRNAVNRFVSNLVRSQDETLTRWSSPICPSVAGASRDLGEFVLGRISQAALQAGAPLDSTTCRANLHVILTDDAAQLVKTLRKRKHGIFGETVPTALDRFMNTNRPVRAWYTTALANEDGTPPMSDAGTKGRFRLRDSRIVSTLIENLTTVIVVVDNRLVQNASVGQLADYIAMVGLAQVNLDAEFENSTILQVFASPASAHDQPAGLTEWDLAFLKGLYRTHQGSLNQRSLIVASMFEEVSR